jgi:hypothetical protein
MSVGTILLTIFILILLYLVIAYVVRDANKLSDVISGKTMTKIDSDQLSTSEEGGNESNFTYSVWFYIDDWNYRYGEPKVIFGRMGSPSVEGTGSINGVGGLDPCPAVVLTPLENNLVISLGCYPGANDVPTNPLGRTVVHNCAISNIPIQKWVNLLISVYNRTLDVYLDGKLVKTCLLPGVAKVNQKAPIFLTPKGGFSGWTSKLQYWPNSTDPQEAWNIYTKGYGASWLSTIFGQYKVEVTVTKNGEEVATTST